MKNIKKLTLSILQAWNEARLAYSKRYAKHLLGS